MEVRTYQEEDLEEILALFYNTVHTINAKDYNVKQRTAWADGNPDKTKWNKSLLQHYTIVAIEQGRIVGFGDIDSQQYLDRLYIHKEMQRTGVATAICDKLEEQAAGRSITVHASITAKPFFEHRGYQIKKEQQVERHGVLLTNYVMVKPAKESHIIKADKY